MESIRDISVGKPPDSITPYTTFDNSSVPGDPVSRSPANVQLFRGLSRCQSGLDKGLRGRNGLPVECRAAGPPTTISCRRNSVPRALGDQPPLEVGNRPEDMKHQLAGGRSRIDAFLEADQVDAVRLEVLNRFEQFLERAPEAVEAVEAGDTEAVTGAGMVDELIQSWALELPPGDHVDEDADGAGLVQAVFLGGDILVRSGHAGIAEDVSLAGRPGRLFNARFVNTPEGHLNPPVQDLRLVPLFVPIIQAVSKRAMMFLRRAIWCSEHFIPHGHARLNVISATNLAMRPLREARLNQANPRA